MNPVHPLFTESASKAVQSHSIVPIILEQLRMSSEYNKAIILKLVEIKVLYKVLYVLNYSKGHLTAKIQTQISLFRIRERSV